MDDDDEDEEEDPYVQYQREFGVSKADKDVSRALTGGLQKTVSLDYEIRIDFLAYVYVQFFRIETLYFKQYLLKDFIASIYGIRRRCPVPPRVYHLTRKTAWACSCKAARRR